MDKVKSCGCIIIKDDKVLLISAKDNNGNLIWSFPKGHQEEGETDIETAIRETKEEIGLDVEITNNNPIKTGHLVHNGAAYKEILLFASKPLNNEIKMQEDEVIDAQWVRIGEASKYLNGYYGDAWDKFLARLEK